MTSSRADEAVGGDPAPTTSRSAQPGRSGGVAGSERPRRRRSEKLAPYLFLAPLFAVFAAFYLWPAANTIFGSFFEWGLLNPWRLTDPATWEFVGLSNYTTVLASARFWNAVVNTAIWLVLFPALVTVVSLLAAVAIWHVRVGKPVFRTVFLLPMAISLVAAGVIWTFMYDPDFGVLPAVLDTVGLDRELSAGPLQFNGGHWLSNPGVIDLGFVEIRLINVSLVIAGFWAFTGWGVIIFTAGLSSMPTELLEAARVDGARAAQVVWHVIVPLLRGPMAIVVTLSVIFSLRTFDIVWVITGGGPGNDSEVLAVLLWKQAFVHLDSPRAGLATAVAVLMSAALLIAAYPYLRRLEYQE